MREAILHVSKYVGQERAGKKDRFVEAMKVKSVLFVCLFIAYCPPSLKNNSSIWGEKGAL